MAFSALHVRKARDCLKAYTNNDHELLEASHLEQSLATYRPSLLNSKGRTDDIGSDPVFSTAVLLFFRSCSELDFNPSSRIRDSSFAFMRGVVDLIKENANCDEIMLYKCRHIKPLYFPEDVFESGSEIFDPCQKLMRLVDNFRDMKPQERECCKRIITSLSSHLCESIAFDHRLGMVQEMLLALQRWQAHCPHDFDPLLNSFHPVALVILAYYYAACGTVVSLSQCRWWWFEHKPGYVIKTIADYLGADWDEWMEWPKAIREVFEARMVEARMAEGGVGNPHDHVFGLFHPPKPKSEGSVGWAGQSK
jgi:hypothetical protein